MSDLSIEEYMEKVKEFLTDVLKFDVVDIIRWMNTPNSDWKGFSPCTMISVGKGELVLEHLMSKNNES